MICDRNHSDWLLIKKIKTKIPILPIPNPMTMVKNDGCTAISPSPNAPKVMVSQMANPMSEK